MLALASLPLPSVAAPGALERVGPSLARRLATAPQETVAAWVTFTDRAGADTDPAALRAARDAWPAKALDRRRRRGTMRDLVASDLPVHEPYVRAVEARGLSRRGTSRWLNAVSVNGPAADVAALAVLPFVARVELVPRGRRIADVVEPEILGRREAPRLDARDSGSPPLIAAAPGDTAYYGGSHRQLSMMQVPSLHGMGLTGQGVLVCMLDSGFRTTHRAFAGLDIVATRDFIHLDANVDDEAGQDPNGAGGHGTMTLGCVAASRPGTYSGGAFRASVALGKTEDIATETPVEMDYWQFGAEWADSLGADVISSSLGYTEFDDPFPDYTYDDMDGRTTVVARAAVEAARRGIVVVNSAGNAAAAPWHYVVSPGDADSIITAGAVDSNNVVASFSSRGPTADGRIKPDVTAMGRSVLLVSFNTESTYVRANGTSFSAPLTSGLVALLLEAHPSWGPFEVREALRETALNHAAPNNDIGWGLAQGLAAYGWLPSTLDVPAPPATTLRLALSPNPWPGDGGVSVRFALDEPAECRLSAVDAAGRVRWSRVASHAAGDHTLTVRPGRDGVERLAPGVYWIRLETRGDSGPRSVSRRLIVTS